MSNQPYAVFDIDGTLIRWQLYHALADELAQRNLLDAEQYQTVRVARMNWKKRTSTSAFQHYEVALVQLIDAAMPRITPAQLNDAAESIIEIYKDQVYTYTRQLIGQLKAQDYLLFAISASHQEVVGLIADYYDFDDYGGSRYEVEDGRFSGAKHVLRRGKKPELLKQLIAKHDAKQTGSLGIGDTESDIPMLSVVETPIAFNPTRDLFEHARAHSWKVVLERKHVIYELEPVGSSYKLATND